MSKPTRFAAPSLLHFGNELLMACGLSHDRAKVVAEALLEGDLLGHTTHGFALLPSYLLALEENSMEKCGNPTVVADYGTALTWDGKYLPGPFLVREGIRIAQARLAEAPVITLVIRRSHHIGCLQAYLKPVTDAGHVILISCSDPASCTVAPYGSMAPRFSPNPLAAGIPTAKAPILMDISMATTANAVCKRWATEGQRAPGPWLINREGCATDDPTVIAEGSGGSLLPLGGMDLGYKGFALLLLVESLTNALGGHGRSEPEPRWGASVFLQLIDPDGFGGRNAFLRESSFLAEACRTSPVAPGKPPVRLPGEAAQNRRAYQLAHGVELHPSILPAFEPWAERLNVKLPKPQNLKEKLMNRFTLYNVVFLATSMVALLSVSADTTSVGGNTATIYSPEVLPGKGLAEHPFLCCGENDQHRPAQTMTVVRDGKVVWTYSIPMLDPR